MSVPQHVGVIVDGNRRWAKAKGLPTLEGHEAGYRRVKELARWLFSRGVKLASFYLFSRENWHRSKEGVAYLMRLLEQGLARDVKEFKRDAIRLLFAGGREQLPPRLRQLMQQATEETKQGTAGTVCACINYGGQQEIVEAVQRLAASGRELSELSADELKGAMTTAELPPCDLIIRTSGEQRLSNFLLWESAYAELYFTPTFFPDFNEVELDKALAWFSDRQRRFGT